MTKFAVILAGGMGVRAQEKGADEPKQFRRLAGRTVIERALTPFLAHPDIDAVLPVVLVGWEDHFRKTIAPHPKILDVVPGGASRQESARAGLEALAADPQDRVLIHDAARPFVGSDTISAVLSALEDGGAAIPALPVSDTLKRATGGQISETIDRREMFSAQTPQGFRYALIVDAHRSALNSDHEFTDDASIAEWAGISVSLVSGDSRNRKLTTSEDFEMAEALLAGEAGSGRREIRTGTGYDVHRFGPGDSVWICGVSVSHGFGLLGHSDADVALHALTDALLGAIADGDIGSHFPPSDMRWKEADSAIFLKHAADLVRGRGGRLVNLDVTVICERPKVGPHREAMRRRVAEILDIDMGRVAVKATTSEGLGFTGRREGIAAQAVATVELPGED